MPYIRPSQRSTPEGALFVLAVALVCAVCVPLSQWAGSEDEGATSFQSVPSRLLGPEKIACYCAFVWGGFILIAHYLEVRRQRKVFRLDLLPTDPGVRILPEDARPLLRKIDQQSQEKPYILTGMIRLALSRYSVSRSGADVTEAVRTQADVEMGRLVSGMSTVHYLAWAIPALGFLGTVRGLSMSFQDKNNLTQAMDKLNYMFDSTLIALAVSLPLMFLLHRVQRDEESLVLDCQQYCLENLVARLYEPEPVTHATP